MNGCAVTEASPPVAFAGALKPVVGTAVAFPDDGVAYAFRVVDVVELWFSAARLGHMALRWVIATTQC